MASMSYYILQLMGMIVIIEGRTQGCGRSHQWVRLRALGNPCLGVGVGRELGHVVMRSYQMCSGAGILEGE